MYKVYKVIILNVSQSAYWSDGCWLVAHILCDGYSDAYAYCMWGLTSYCADSSPHSSSKIKLLSNTGQQCAAYYLYHITKEDNI